MARSPHNVFSLDCPLWEGSITQVIVFAFGVILGILLGLSLAEFEVAHNPRLHYRMHAMRHLVQAQPLDDEVNEQRNNHSTNGTLHNGEDIVDEDLKSQVRVLCLVSTTQDTFENSGESVNRTWGRRCSKLLFVSDFEDSDLPVVKLYAGRSGNQIENWALIKSAMKHAFDHYLDTYDWVLRVDDRTFVVMENLWHLLSKYESSDPLYLGFRLNKFVEQGFMSKDAGYVLSREAVQRFITEGVSKDICSSDDGGLEDVLLGSCLEALKVMPVDTRDTLGRGRFFPFSPNDHIIPGNIPSDSWIWGRSYYPISSGFNCCSDTAISFHNVDHETMIVMEYMIYHLRPFGINTPITQP